MPLETPRLRPATFLTVLSSGKMSGHGSPHTREDPCTKSREVDKTPASGTFHLVQQTWPLTVSSACLSMEAEHKIYFVFGPVGKTFTSMVCCETVFS